MRRRVVAVLAACVIAAAAGYVVSRATSPSTPSAGGSGASAAESVRSLIWRSRELGPAAFGATACAGSQRCLAFGLGGAFASSTNGGRSWTVTQLSITTKLTVVAAACPSTNRCVALGENAGSAIPPAAPQATRGVALVSTDSGHSWSEALVRGPAVQFSGGLACPTTADCYATVSSLAGRTPADFLLASSDGGVSWTTRRSGPRYGLGRALACSAAGDCLATGGTGGIVATSDGGLRWVDESEPIGGGGRPGIEALACSSLTTCTGVGTEPSPGYPVIVTTRDGGASWRFAEIRPPSSGARGLLNEVAGGGYSAVNCSGLRCVAAADTLPEIGLVAESSDGGRTWRQSALGGGGSFSGVTCAAAGGCIVAGTIGDGSALLALGSSAQQWTKRYMGPSTDLSSLSCPSSQHCVAAGGAGPVPVAAAMMTSDDGGAHWSASALPRGLRGIAALDCPTTLRCFAVVDVAAPEKLSQDGDLFVSAIISSDDGGRRWRRDELRAPAGAFDALSCPTLSTCYAVGASPGGAGVLPQDVVLRTNDDGARWVADQVPAFPPQPPVGTSGSEILGGGLTNVSCFGPRQCLAGGPAGMLATNDGVHWSVRYQTPGAGHGGVVSGGILFGQLQLLTCSTSLRCVGAFTDADGSERLRISANGGRSWGMMASPTIALSALDCPTSLVCLAAGSDANGAAILETFDGGRRWSAAPVPTPPVASTDGVAAPGYTAIACAEQTYCVALGAGSIGEEAIAR